MSYTLTQLHAAFDRGASLAGTDVLFVADTLGNEYGISVADLLANIPSPSTFEDVVQLNKVVCADAEYDNGNSGATPAVDWTNGNFQKITLTANATFAAFTSPGGPATVLLKLIQDGTGGRTIDFSSNNTIHWESGGEPSWSVGIGDVDIVMFYFDGTIYYGSYLLDLLVEA